MQPVKPLGQLMRELEAAGFRPGRDRFGRFEFERVRPGKVYLPPGLAMEVAARAEDALAWLDGEYFGDDADEVCGLCRATVTPLGKREGMVFGLCDRRTNRSECDGKTALCPYRRFR